jgi:hypothetical protein
MRVSPETLSAGTPALTGSEGELVLVSIAVEPRLLEELLDTLAELPFPVNPEIYHSASVVRVYLDGRREVAPAIIVDFPAYAGRLPVVRTALQARDFPPESVWARNILEQIHCASDSGPAPEGAPYRTLIRCRLLVPAA